MDESRGPAFDAGGWVSNLLVASPESIHRLIMESPDLPATSHGDRGGPPKPDEDGDKLPDPDWRLVAVLSFGLGFSAYSALYFGRALLGLLK